VTREERGGVVLTAEDNVFEATLCFLVQGDPPERVLLGRKKVGFGKDKYGGVGGKINAGETAAHAAVRELHEETGVLAAQEDLEPAAHLTFLFPHRPEWSQVVHVYVTRAWTGSAKPSREIDPAWFPVTEIPFPEMWDDCQHWLPRVLGGEWTRGRFVFGPDNDTVAEFDLRSWKRGSRAGA
jgi:8-oxo-dGTP diphosphatase